MVGDLGAGLISELIHNNGLPVYAVSTSWNVHNNFDINSLTILNSYKLKGSHSFFKQSFEKINPSFVSGVISEKGTHPCSVFFDVVKKDRKKS